jgi:hypothetical protein
MMLVISEDHEPTADLQCYEHPLERFGIENHCT